MYIDDKFYRQVLKSMPISCVDLLVINMEKRVLMIKRRNPPAKGQWWFPGGRVHFGELRKKAAIRKLKEECGLTLSSLKELGTYDVLLEEHLAPHISHAITTVFEINVSGSNVRLDDQSSDYMWKTPLEWLDEIDNEFILRVLEQYKHG
ncbi:MAG: NUDIX domain-containing protein [Candidatus Margulisiibacteriota bacterium]